MCVLFNFPVTSNVSRATEFRQTNIPFAHFKLTCWLNKFMLFLISLRIPLPYIYQVAPTTSVWVVLIIMSQNRSSPPLHRFAKVADFLNLLSFIVAERSAREYKRLKFYVSLITLKWDCNPQDYSQEICLPLWSLPRRAEGWLAHRTGKFSAAFVNTTRIPAELPRQIAIHLISGVVLFPHPPLHLHRKCENYYDAANELMCNQLEVCWAPENTLK